jgi:hypothetical protein
METERLATWAGHVYANFTQRGKHDIMRMVDNKAGDNTRRTMLSFANQAAQCNFFWRFFAQK